MFFFTKSNPFRLNQTLLAKRIKNKAFSLLLAREVKMGIVGGRFGKSFQWHEHPNCIVEAVSDLSPAGREELLNTASEPAFRPR